MREIVGSKKKGEEKSKPEAMTLSKVRDALATRNTVTLNDVE